MVGRFFSCLRSCGADRKEPHGDSIYKMDGSLSHDTETCVVHYPRQLLEGKSEDGNTIIDTLLTKRVNNVSVQLDKQGLVDDASIYKKMEGIFESDE